jgi:hypothetical protein
VDAVKISRLDQLTRSVKDPYLFEIRYRFDENPARNRLFEGEPVFAQRMQGGLFPPQERAFCDESCRNMPGYE